eukprot:PhF_6_TR6988/c3_g1_i1/m.10356
MGCVTSREVSQLQSKHTGGTQPQKAQLYSTSMTPHRGTTYLSRGLQDQATKTTTSESDELQRSQEQQQQQPSHHHQHPPDELVPWIDAPQRPTPALNNNTQRNPTTMNSANYILGIDSFEEMHFHHSGFTEDDLIVSPQCCPNRTISDQIIMDGELTLCDEILRIENIVFANAFRYARSGVLEILNPPAPIPNQVDDKLYPPWSSQTLCFSATSGNVAGVSTSPIDNSLCKLPVHLLLSSATLDRIRLWCDEVVHDSTFGGDNESKASLSSCATSY